MGWIYLSCIDKNNVTNQLHGSRVSLARHDGLTPAYYRQLYVDFAEGDKPMSQSNTLVVCGVWFRCTPSREDPFSPLRDTSAYTPMPAKPVKGCFSRDKTKLIPHPPNLP